MWPSRSGGVSCAVHVPRSESGSNFSLAVAWEETEVGLSVLGT